MVTESPEQADDWEAKPRPASDPPAPVETGDAGCLPFELYAPGWQAGWGQAVRDADPR